MIQEFFFQVDNRMHYGAGWCRKKLPDFLKERGYRAVAVLVDEGVRAHNPYFKEVMDLLASTELTVEMMPLRGSEEPDYDYLDEITEKIRALPALDAVFGIGGGSTLDIAKTVAALRTNSGPAIKFRGFDHLLVPPVDSIIIPSTAGTGSEVTINAAFIDKKEKRKLGINGRYINATYAILDAEWTLSCPFKVAVSSGMDALTHVVEAYSTTFANPLTRAINREAFRMLYDNLPCLVDDPGNLEKRQLLQLGAYLGGLGLYNAGGGIAMSCSYPIGVHWGVPHGIGGGILLAAVVEYNVARGYYDYAELLDVVEPHPDWSREQKAKRFVEVMVELADRLSVPKDFSAWGLSKADLERLLGMMPAIQAGLDQNPLPFPAETEAVKILKKHLK